MGLRRESPFADVYGKDELLEVVADAPLVHANPVDEIGPGTLRVFVIDE